MIDKDYVHLFLDIVLAEFLLGRVPDLSAAASIALDDTIDGSGYSKDEQLVINILAIPFMTQVHNKFVDVNVCYSEIEKLLPSITAEDLFEKYNLDEIVEITTALKTIDPDGRYADWIKATNLIIQTYNI